MKRKILNLAAAALIAAAGGYAGAAYYKATEKRSVGQASAIEAAQKAHAVHFANMPGPVPNAINFVDAAEKTVPAVVYVKTTYPVNASSNWFYNPFRDFFYNNPQRGAPQQSTGSGVIVSDDGYIVTNNHVVQQAAKVEVTLDDKRSFSARVVGTDPNTDLALLKIDEKNLPFIPYGNSDQVHTGEWVLAVGNPFNLTSTVTAGIVSAKGRNIRILDNQPFPLESFIQTDAAVNPGNSGGALVNTTGELIGINSAIASTTGAYAGYSFAIPVNLVRKVIDDLLEYGNVQRGFIGVQISDIDQELADEKKLGTMKGVYVRSLTDNGAAQAAGIREGDVITRIDGNTVATSAELQEQVGRFRPGDKIDVTVLRGSSEKDIDVVLRNNFGDTHLLKKDDVLEMLGAEFAEVSDADRQKLGIRNGVQVVKLEEGKLRSAGIRNGFIITKIDNESVRSLSDLQERLRAKQRDGVLIEGIYPNGLRAYYGFGM